MPLKVKIRSALLCSPIASGCFRDIVSFSFTFSIAFGTLAAKPRHQIVLGQGNHPPYDRNFRVHFRSIAPVMKASNLSSLPSMTLLIPNSMALARVAG